MIANRGEIALRVISACKEMGIRTVAVYSEADRNSLHVKFADEAICIGPPKSAESYLNVPAVISAAEIADVEAIHPGYGLLSENANFAEVCRASNIKFIGPPPEVTRLMGEKSTARQTMKKAGVPILPGSDGIIEDETSALKWAKNVGYPVILKAVAGGGGRGMRIVRNAAELPGMFQQASSEAAGAFGNGDLYMEKFIERPRHIEFLMDEDGKIYFIEMNTRIQVEHCVTEMVTGIDLVKAQIRIAAGHKLSDIVTKPVTITGHAIECRVNAEHPEKFTPSAGKITAFNLPGGNGVRVDTAQYAEGVVPPYYDSLIAKLICHGKDREESMNKMQRALSQFVVQGIYTSIPLHQKIFADAEFRAGKFDTKFMERFFEREGHKQDAVVEDHFSPLQPIRAGEKTHG